MMPVLEDNLGSAGCVSKGLRELEPPFPLCLGESCIPEWLQMMFLKKGKG
jgi:hypothetical protein